MDKGVFKKLNKYHVIFLVQNSMIGISLFSLPQLIHHVGFNQWLIPIILGILANLVLVPMIMLCKRYPGYSIFAMNETILGKWLGSFFNILFILIFILSVSTVSALHLRLVQTVSLPNQSTLLPSIIFYCILIYIVLGGIKSVARFSIFAFFLTAWMTVYLLWPYQAGYIIQVKPILQGPITSWIEALHSGSQAMFGFELILVYFPYIMQQEKAFKHVSYGIWLAVFFYIATSFVSVMYFSEWQLENVLYPALKIFQAVELTFIERVENLGINLWIFLALSTCTVYLWAAKKGADAVFSNYKNRVRHLYALALISILSYHGPVPQPVQNFIFEEVLIYSIYGTMLWPLLLLMVSKLRGGVNKHAKIHQQV